MRARNACLMPDMDTTPKPGIYLPPSAWSDAGTVPRKALFLDRDGVINVNHGYVCSADRTDWVDGIFQLCALARRKGYLLVVVTNQAGIARGYYSEADFLEYTRWLHGEFGRRGADILATVYCPHHPTAGLGDLGVTCGCRKPAPGMFFAASRKLNLDLGKSVMVGDKRSDLEAASKAGIPKVYLVDPASSDPFGEVTRGLTTADQIR